MEVEVPAWQLPATVQIPKTPPPLTFLPQARSQAPDEPCAGAAMAARQISGRSELNARTSLLPAIPSLVATLGLSLPARAGWPTASAPTGFACGDPTRFSPELGAPK